MGARAGPGPGAARRGVALVRYHRAPSPDAVSDVELAVAAWTRVTRLPSVDTRRVVLLGHSEGTWQATLTALWLQALPEVPPPAVVIEAGVFALDVPAAVEAQVAAIYEPLAREAERRGGTPTP